MGQTNSHNFPNGNAASINGGFQANLSGAGGGATINAFVSELDPTGSFLIYSTFLGNNPGVTISGRAIVLDGADDAYITGNTAPFDLPAGLGTQFLAADPGGSSNAFVAELDPTGTILLNSTYLGGSGTGDGGRGINLDTSDNVYVTGFTNSGDFPTMNPLPMLGTNQGGRDAFASVLDAGLDTLIFSTYLGGSGSDIGTGILVDPFGNIDVTGSTFSTEPSFLPTTAPPGFTANAGGEDAFLVSFNDAPPPAVPPLGTGVNGNFPLDRFATNDVSNLAFDFGNIGGNYMQNLTQLSIGRFPNGMVDYNWFRYEPLVSGTFTATFFTTAANGPLELELFTLNSQNTLIQLQDNNSGGLTLGVTATITAGAPILVELKGLATAIGVQQQGEGFMIVTLT